MDPPVSPLVLYPKPDTDILYGADRLASCIYVAGLPPFMLTVLPLKEVVLAFLEALLSCVMCHR